MLSTHEQQQLYEIKRKLNKQYSSKGNANKELLQKELQPLLPDGFIILTNPFTGYLYITRI